MRPHRHHRTGVRPYDRSEARIRPRPLPPLFPPIVRPYDWQRDDGPDATVVLSLPVAKAIQNLLRQAKPHLFSRQAVEDALAALEPREGGSWMAPFPALPGSTQEKGR